MNVGIAHYGSGELAARLHDILNQPTGLSDLGGDPAIRNVFDAALHWSFWGVVVVALTTCATIWLIPVTRDAGRGSSVVKADAQDAMTH